ncbi:phosphoglycolate phosphatase [Inhella inkyongensis]|uniref:Phosphoglycolate phosphatase n=1 Tax=Inhella inkyongensis TaxID=392593 RepID=A0A840S7F1_9BURK|nr:HAD-IIIA family hydrolase [Inhella inkyongensis]MBB5204380.1 phosphoglycolate phosphatase [Inhella inkyongensis]
MNLNYELLVFDWDGTLFDSTACIVKSIQLAAREFGLPEVPVERARHVIGLGLEPALKIAVPELPAERYRELAHAYRRHYFATVHEVTLFEGVPELLQALQARGHRLAVATGKSRRGLDEALEQVGLRGLFEATRTADETASKPHPQMLHELMDELGVPAHRSLMIGDTTHDLQLAANAGTAALAVAFGAHGEGELRALQPLAVLHDVPALAGWLKSHG